MVKFGQNLGFGVGIIVVRCFVVGNIVVVAEEDILVVGFEVGSQFEWLVVEDIQFGWLVVEDIQFELLVVVDIQFELLVVEDNLVEVVLLVGMDFLVGEGIQLVFLVVEDIQFG